MRTWSGTKAGQVHPSHGVQIFVLPLSWFAFKPREGAIPDGILRLDPAQFEALFAGLDWRRVTSLEPRPPAAAE